MTQFNLLPDVKLEYLRAERSRRLISSVSVLVTLAAIALMLLLFSVTLLQKKHLNDLNSDIKKESSSIQHQKDLNRILTVQNQLESLTGLHDAKPAAARLVGYLNQVTPVKANINNLKVDFTAQAFTITGTADSLATINQYVDTLKFATYQLPDSKDTPKAFSQVVLTAFGVTEHEFTYTIDLKYDPPIFDSTKTVTLIVPPQVTTRSQLDKPNALFTLPIDKSTTSTGTPKG